MRAFMIMIHDLVRGCYARAILALDPLLPVLTIILLY
jgi:hypothetical protein